jgi:transcriptional regulator with XRE-family HTH domain
MKQPRRCSLRAARVRAGLTQVQLAQLAGILQSMVSKLESGQVSHPRFSTVVNLARVLHIDPALLRFDVVHAGAPILHRIARQKRTGTNKVRQRDVAAETAS